MEEQPPPLVSVIVTTYNRAHLLQECLYSILEQTYKNVEILVLCDGGTDGSEAVASTFPKHLVRFIKEQHTGIPGVLRNKGIYLSRGKYIAFCDDDDLWAPQKLEKQLQAFREDPELGLVCTGVSTFPVNPCNLLFIKKSIRVVKNLIIRFFKARYQYLIPFYNFICFSSVLVRKDVFREAGFFCEERLLKGVEDFELWLRMSNKQKILFLEEKLVYYRRHENNLSIDRRTMFKKVKIALKKQSLEQGLKIPLPTLWLSFVYNTFREYMY